MCDFHNASEHQGFGFLVDKPEIRALIAETRKLMAEDITNEERVKRLEPAFRDLLAADGWLPDEYGSPDFTSGMGSGIGQYALYRAHDLCLFSLVVPTKASTPVHDHLAWGLIGVYRGAQDEIVYKRVDDGSVEGEATLEVTLEHTMQTGQLYALIPPTGDIHEVKTVSDVPSVSIHLLANDTACVWRHQFLPKLRKVKPFRSGYSNAPCPPEETPPPPGADAPCDS